MDAERPKTTLVDGSPVTPEHREINPETGMQRDYVVLSDEERAKGFVRPVRRAYVHVGIRPKHALRPLTPEEVERYGKFGYAMFEGYPDSESSISGRFWTREELESGCGYSTVMARTIAETYARDPGFYGSTFCTVCRQHFPVAEFVWAGTDERVGT